MEISNKPVMCKLTKFLSLIIIFCFCSSVKAEENDNYKINKADYLEVLEDKVLLEGSVSVSSLGDEKFTLNTQKLISLKDPKNPDVSGDIETFGRSEIVSEKFQLFADKIFFRKDIKLNKYNWLEAEGNVKINSTESDLFAPKVRINLLDKKLFAYNGVKSEQIIENNNKKETVIILSEEQEIDLNEIKNTLQKKLIAKKEVKTSMPQGNIKSDWAEIFVMNGKANKSIFTGNAELITTDNDIATGQTITYFMEEKLLLVESGNKVDKAVLKKQDGTEIVGTKIRYNTEKNILLVEGGSKLAILKKSDGTEIIGSNIKYDSNTKELNVTENNSLASLKVPIQDKNGQITMAEIKANMIETIEGKNGETLLQGSQKDDIGLVEILYGNRRGWGKKLFIIQSKKQEDKVNDKLVLLEDARLIDYDKNQTIEGGAIEIGLGKQYLYSGFSRRARGITPLKQN